MSHELNISFRKEQMLYALILSVLPGIPPYEHMS